MTPLNSPSLEKTNGRATLVFSAPSPDQGLKGHSSMARLSPCSGGVQLLMLSQPSPKRGHPSLREAWRGGEKGHLQARTTILALSPDFYHCKFPRNLKLVETKDCPWPKLLYMFVYFGVSLL